MYQFHTLLNFTFIDRPYHVNPPFVNSSPGHGPKPPGIYCSNAYKKGDLLKKRSSLTLRQILLMSAMILAFAAMTLFLFTYKKD